jgi:hypothetical protein
VPPGSHREAVSAETRTDGVGPVYVAVAVLQFDEASQMVALNVLEPGATVTAPVDVAIQPCPSVRV